MGRYILGKVSQILSNFQILQNLNLSNEVVLESQCFRKRYMESMRRLHNKEKAFMEIGSLPLFGRTKCKDA